MKPPVKTKILPSRCGCCGTGAYRPQGKRWMRRRIRHALNRLTQKESA